MSSHSRGHLRNRDDRSKMLVFLLRRDGRHCHWCGDRMLFQSGGGGTHEPHAMTFEHLRRRSEGGGATRDNLVLACSRCNRERN